jgi:hypothetical protein
MAATAQGYHTASPQAEPAGNRVAGPHSSAIFNCMIRRTYAVLESALALGSLAGALAAVALSAAAPAASAGTSTARQSSLLQSRELWATVDVCNPADQRNTIGIRGSMPGDGSSGDSMYMRFQLQYMSSNGSWLSLARGGNSGFVAAGPAKATRQAGTSFQLMPVKGKPAYLLRGFATFQWRHDGKVLHEATRTTSASHGGVADADPRGYSAAECKMS